MFLKELRKTGRGVILTVKGKAAAVIQEPEAYQHLLDLAAAASPKEGIRQGLDDVEQGRGTATIDTVGESSRSAESL